MLRVSLVVLLWCVVRYVWHRFYCIVYSLPFQEDGHSEWVSCVRFSPNTSNPIIVSAGWDRIVKVWNLTNCKLKTDHFGHTGYVNTVAVSPDGSLCASGGKVSQLFISVPTFRYLCRQRTGSIVRLMTFSGGMALGVVTFHVTQSTPFVIWASEMRFDFTLYESFLKTTVMSLVGVRMTAFDQTARGQKVSWRCDSVLALFSLTLCVCRFELLVSSIIIIHRKMHFFVQTFSVCMDKLHKSAKSREVSQMSSHDWGMCQGLCGIVIYKWLKPVLFNSWVIEWFLNN